MSYKPTLIGCSSANQFFDRFKASENQRKNYKPIFLAIVYSSYGECAPSYGLFERNKQLYSVYGTECSVWDFNGQFEPELTTIDNLLLEVKQGIGIIDGQDRFNEELGKCINELQSLEIYSDLKNNILVKDYIDYIHSFEVGNVIKNFNYYIDWDIFKSNLLDIEDGIKVYKFKIKSDWEEELTLFLTRDGKLSCAESKNEPYVKMHTLCIEKFISDFKGSLELKTNIFEEPEPKITQNNKKKKI